ncbi:MAG: chemotaxis protein CheW [Actinomycetota bacterium]
MPETVSGEERLFIFRLSGRLFGLPLAVVREVAPYCALSRPPALPNCLEGFLNLRGQAAPVIRLDRLLSLPDALPGLDSLLLILRDGANRVALLVDEALGIRLVHPEHRSPLSASEGVTPCVSAEARLREGTALLLSPDLLLLAREQAVLALCGETETNL